MASDRPLAAGACGDCLGQQADVPGEQADLLFRSDYDGFVDADALRRRMLKPLVEGKPGCAAFYAFRHTFASMYLSRYAHLLPSELASPLDLCRRRPGPAMSSTTS